jgi:ABC-type multidrug transport system fused ATPase/permease subunit
VSASSKDSVLLRIEHLGRAVKQKVLVDDADFQVHSGEVLAIAGPSGAGKTSLLRLLNRLDEPTTGTVFLKGADYRQIPPRELRRRLGMVTQRPFLFQGTSILRLAAMIAAAGATSARRAKEIPDAFQVSFWAIAFVDPSSQL